MGSLIQSYSMTATFLFVAISAVVGVRMLLLARRTRCEPELFLGLGVLGTAVLGYGVMISAMIVRGPTKLVATRAIEQVLQGTGEVLHDVGVTCFVLFVLATFRKSERWARALAGLLIGCLWLGALGWESQNRYRSAVPGNGFFWLRYAVIWTYPLWGMVESYRYWALMRRRLAIGLVDPMVANRFFLWGTGSLGTCLAIWVSSSSILLYDDPTRALASMPLIQVVTATVGVATVVLYYLTFFPPAAYRRWVRGDAAPA
jgi:hypothetical protein